MSKDCCESAYDKGVRDEKARVVSMLRAMAKSIRSNITAADKEYVLQGDVAMEQLALAIDGECVACVLVVHDPDWLPQ